MFKFIGILFLVLVFFAIMTLMFFASVVFSVISKLRKMIYGDPANRDDEYTGRRQQQYSYRGGTAGQQSTDKHNTQQRTSNSTSKNSETIIDTRSPHQTNNRIFDDNEGEYVDFIEE